MNPTPPDANSPLATLRQLKEMLDAGAITQQEFDALKQRLIFGGDPATAAGPPAGSPEAPAPAGPAAWEGGPAAPTPAYAAPVGANDSTSPTVPVAPATPPPPYLDTPAALTPEATPLLTPEPDWLAAPAPALLSHAGDDERELTPTEAAERRNPLNLIFALGGLLLFLAVVAYLVYERRPDEHVTSQTQTAADSTAVAPEVGPQAEQLVLPPATAPETVRVAPAVVPTAVPSAADSAALQAIRPASPAARPAPAPAPATTTTPEGRMEAAADSVRR